MANTNQMLYKLAEDTLPVSIIRSKRKTISLQLKDNTIILKAPVFLSDRHAFEFIDSKQQWLNKQRKKLNQIAPKTLRYQDKDTFLLFGTSFQFRLFEGSRFSSVLDKANKTLSFTIPPNLKNEAEYTKTKFKQFIMQEAQNELKPRFHHLEANSPYHASSLEFKFYKRRWGCCYQSGKIILNPLLVCAPQFVIDCVIKHELCHLEHMNHSKQFWQSHQQMCSDCTPTDRWLYEHTLAIQL